MRSIRTSTIALVSLSEWIAAAISVGRKPVPSIRPKECSGPGIRVISWPKWKEIRRRPIPPITSLNSISVASPALIIPYDIRSCFSPYYRNAVKKDVRKPVANHHNNYLSGGHKFAGELDIKKIHKFYIRNENLPHKGGRKEGLDILLHIS